MKKKIILIFSLLAFTNCSAPGTALLGPVFTGATTGSIGQATLSYGTNQIVQTIRETSKKTKKELTKITKKVENLNLEMKSKDFYVSVKSLYLKDKAKKKKIFLFHR